MLTAQEILQLLEQKRTEVRRLGVKRLGLFGSAARGEAGKRAIWISSWNCSRRALKELLEQWFGRHVDLVIAETVKPQLRSRILQETVYAARL